MKPQRGISFMVFAACAGAVGVSLVLLSVLSLNLERREAQARTETKFQESIRLAIWKMESVAAPVIRREASRPYFEYMPFYPTDRAYTRMFEEVRAGDVLVPSPLLTSTPTFIRLHFQIDESSRLTSPQSPEGNQLDLAEAEYVSGDRVERSRAMLDDLSAMLFRGPVDASPSPTIAREALPHDRSAALGLLAESALPPLPSGEDAGAYDADLSASRDEEKRDQSKQRAGELLRQRTDLKAVEPQEAIKDILRSNQSPTLGQLEDEGDYLERARGLRDGYGQTLSAQTAESGQTSGILPDGAEQIDTMPTPGGNVSASRDGAFEQQVFTPVWRTGRVDSGPQLFFIREVHIGGATRFQGFWVDWDSMRSAMLGAGADLLPDARLEPVYEGNDVLARNTSGRMIASMPALLIPGAVPAATIGPVTPTRFALVLVWVLAIAAMAMIWRVLRASTDLAERRGQFVTAVTHELRTPLTTFCLYTDLLADNLVKEEQTRHDYLSTLRGESRRLAGIVEGVLEYARLGRRTKPLAAEQIEVQAAMSACLPALIDRATAGGMSIVFSSDGLAGVRCAADQSTLDRILLNLIENACKYAGDAEDRRIDILAAVSGGQVVVRVRDYGPGVAQADRARIFEPFQRARRDADGPNPGLGLGLALSRGLARELGGDLRYQPPLGPGAQFVLTIPARPAEG